MTETHEFFIRIKRTVLPHPLQECNAIYLQSKDDLKLYKNYLLDNEQTDSLTIKPEFYEYPNWFITHLNISHKMEIKTLPMFMVEIHDNWSVIVQMLRERSESIVRR